MFKLDDVHQDADGVISESWYRDRVGQWQPERWQIFQPLVEQVKKVTTSESRILDLGAGEGFFTKCCAENGLSAVALEGSETAVSWGKEHLGINIQTHNLKEDLPFADRHFDLVMLHDVYEHLPTFINRRLFREANRVLKHSGIFWVITTNKYDRVETAHSGHINNPTPTELGRFGKRFGFQPIYLMPNFNTTLFIWNYWRKKEGRAKDRSRKLRKWMLANNQIITCVLAPIWFPIWWCNRRVFHMPILDIVCDTSNIMFKKTTENIE
jgi:SAM-dependent methyltransferase